MLTTFDLDDYVVDAFRAGASGFLLKTAPPAQLVAAVRTVHSGDALLTPASTRRLIEQLVHPSGEAPPLTGLTGREHDVLLMLAVVEPSTIKSHVASVLASSTYATESTPESSPTKAHSCVPARPSRPRQPNARRLAIWACAARLPG